MANDVNFDELARKTIESNGAMDDLNNLYGAAFALEKWHFISRGTLPDIHPYIASNADYADGQQMVRAFTDTARLMNFARENNLTEADGSAPILSVPTANIVEYLEQFIAYGVHGIWFNSDTESDGFFLPLRQLRAVREHLAKINWQPPFVNAAADRVETLLIVVKDGLMFPSGFVSEASNACNFFCRVPADWTDGKELKPEYLEKIYQKVYGVNWRLGNDDGSQYVVINSFTIIYTPEAARTLECSGMTNGNGNSYWFYTVDERGELQKVTAEEFQADVDASFQ
jgi:hypothetical protein